MSQPPEQSDARAPALAQTNVPVQFAWYLVVGGSAFIVDLALFSALLQVGIAPLYAVTAAFLVGACVNYKLSLSLAFTEGSRSTPRTIVALVAVSLAGLALTIVIMESLIHLGIAAIPARMTAASMALVWNYAARRLLVFSTKMPVPIWKVSELGLNKLGILHSKPGRVDGDHAQEPRNGS